MNTLNIHLNVNEDLKLEDEKNIAQAAIPEEITQGIDTQSPNLLDRRAHWNEPTPEQWALPTEIWRESMDETYVGDAIWTRNSTLRKSTIL